MKLRVTKPNLYHNGSRKAVGDIITVTGDKIPTVFAGKVETVNEAGLTTDQDAGGDVAALQAERDELSDRIVELGLENDDLRAENAELRASIEGQGDGSDSDSGDSDDTTAEADDKRKAWLLDEIESMTGKRPGGNSSLETLEKKFEEAKLAQE